MMGLVYPELSLDLKATSCNSNTTFVPKTIYTFLKNTIIDHHHHLDVDDFVKRLKDEMNKIQVFKRELPLSMLLLKHALEALQQEIQRTSDSKSKTINAYEPVLEHFIPLKTESTPQEDDQVKQEEDEDDQVISSSSGASSDKNNWMSSVQLWTPHQPNKHQTTPKVDYITPIEQAPPPKPKLNVPNLPPPTVRFVEKDPTVSALSLLATGNEMIKHPNPNSNPIPSNSKDIRNSNALFTSKPQSCSSRKQRRCWSPELHRRFVDALTELGGPQEATPKQIRELMRVDGLTNDEVKSHLQKYRLHIRRVPNNSAAEKGNSGIGMSRSWTSQDEHIESSKASNSESGSPEGPLQFPGLTATGCDEMEGEDEEKSESYMHVASWKEPVYKLNLN